MLKIIKNVCRYDISGSDGEDCLASVCFPLCVSCQTAVEVKDQMNWRLECCHINIKCIVIRYISRGTYSYCTAPTI